MLVELYLTIKRDFHILRFSGWNISAFRARRKALFSFWFLKMKNYNPASAVTLSKLEMFFTLNVCASYPWITGHDSSLCRESLSFIEWCEFKYLHPCLREFRVSSPKLWVCIILLEDKRRFLKWVMWFGNS